MPRFSKYNNPSKKRRVRKSDYTERSLGAVNEMLIDKRLGYSIETEFYKKSEK